MIRIKKNITFAMFAYWIVIIIWQTIRPVANRSLVDVMVKMGSFAAMCIYGYNRQNMANTRGISGCIILFLLTQMITYLTDSITSASLITGVFMFAQLLVFLVFLRNASISEEEIKQLGQWIIQAAMIMCLYNVLFNTSRFLRFFTTAGAYGSECKSFLYSNHEFALYVTAAIILTVWNLINGNLNICKSIIMIGFMLINLLSTYSRTAIIGGIAAVLILVFYNNKKSFLVLCGLIGVFAFFVSTNEMLNYYVFDKILKGSYEKSGGLIDQGRASMYQIEVEYYLAGNLLEKLFGHGYVGNRAGGHNAYLSILNTGGIAMFTFFMLVILWSIRNSWRCLKYERRIGSLCLGLQVFALLYMAAQTPILFYSTMDSYFITVIMVMVPLYCLNHLRKKYSLAVT